MAHSYAAPEAVSSRLHRRTASYRLRALRSRPALSHGLPYSALPAPLRGAAAKPPRGLVEVGIGLGIAYAVYTVVAVSIVGAPVWAGQALLAGAGLWLAAVLVSDIRRWSQYSAHQRTKAVLVWATVLVFAIAV